MVTEVVVVAMVVIAVVTVVEPAVADPAVVREALAARQNTTATPVRLSLTTTSSSSGRSPLEAH